MSGPCACLPWLCQSSFQQLCSLLTLRYIRIVGTHNTVNKIFHIVAFECMFTNKAFTLEKGLIGKYYNDLFAYLFRYFAFQYFHILIVPIKQL